MIKEWNPVCIYGSNHFPADWLVFVSVSATSDQGSGCSVYQCQQPVTGEMVVVHICISNQRPDNWLLYVYVSVTREMVVAYISVSISVSISFSNQ